MLPAFLFVKEVIGFDFSDLNPTLRMDQSLQALADEAMAVRNAYFTPDVVLQLFSGIFRRFLVFSPEEEEAWTETPETVAIEEVGEGWQYVLKVSGAGRMAVSNDLILGLHSLPQPCAEKVAKTIITKYHDVVAPRLVALVGESQNPVERESLYNCVHLGIRATLLVSPFASHLPLFTFPGGYGLYDEVPFDDWLPALTREYMDAKPHEHLAPLRRRILLLVTHWMDIRLADSARPLVYECVCSLCREESLQR